ncbi:uncharacterized protein BJ171DRAFT_509115 [Polychytrium aggregatum]|uniref:uncharacterized protein n=1 Tax=Polychytrium aggregatum TaxID=110093 RepID=UPI0022FF1AA4|nr:uncharacterized protein BJ171DRAFT_509115 [Polychytrium aggregatum]KAI9203624.1 hypothetical protein BJ171DRAFT_509115 [Polychytrium aggregatum]
MSSDSESLPPSQRRVSTRILSQRRLASASPSSPAPAATPRTKPVSSARPTPSKAATSSGRKRAVPPALPHDTDESDQDIGDDDASVAQSPPSSSPPTHTTQASDTPEMTLMESLLVPGIALNLVVSEWSDSFSHNEDSALIDLIQFLIESCGLKVSKDKIVLDDDDAVPQIVQSLVDDIESNQQLEDYPLIVKGKGKLAGAKFRRVFGEFWLKWAAKVKAEFTKDETSLEKLKIWVITMTSSIFRPIRHTSVVAALAIQSALCEAAKAVHKEWVVCNKQLETESTKPAGSKRAAAFTERSAELHRKKVQYEMHINDFYTSVFSHRYRDIDANIRAECIHHLGQWILSYPELYLEGQHIRYLGWLLFDKEPHVRSEAIQSLAKLFESNNIEVTSGLLPFVERFKSRLLEMAFRDKDSGVRLNAASTLVQIALGDMLDNDTRDQLLQLLVVDDRKVNSQIAKLAAKTLKDDYIEPKVTSIKGSRSRAKLNRQWIELKCVAVFLAKLLDGVQEGSDSQRLSDSGPSLPREASAGSDPRRCEQLEFTRWLTEIRGEGASMAYHRIKIAVESLYSSMEALQDWHAMANYLSKDLTLSTDDDPENDPYALSDREETALVCMLSASVELLLTDRDTGLWDDRRMELSRDMVKAVPQLVRKYATDFSALGRIRITEVLCLVRSIDLNVYFELRQVSTCEALFDDIQSILMKHASAHVIFECGRALMFLAGDQTLRFGTVHSSSSGTKRTAKSKLAEDGADDASSSAVTGLRETMKTKVEELVEHIVNDQMMTRAKSLHKTLKAHGDLDEADLFGFRNVLVRLDQLMSLVDLESINIVASDDVTTTEADEKYLHSGLFGAVDFCLGVGLLIRNQNEGGVVVQISDDSLGSANEVIEDIIELTLRILAVQTTWDLKKLFSTISPAPNTAGTAAETENTDGPEKAELSAKEVEALAETVHKKTSRLVSTAESLLLGIDQTVFGLKLRRGAVDVLLHFYSVLNSNLVEAYPDMRHVVADDIQPEISRILSAYVDFSSFPEPSGSSTDSGPADVLGLARRLDSEARESARQMLLRTTGSFSNLIKLGVLSPANASILVRYMHVGPLVSSKDGTAVLGGPLVDVLGPVWNSLGESVLSILIGPYLSKAVEMLEQDEAHLRPEFDRLLDALHDAIVDGLDGALDLHYSGRVRSTDPSFQTAKAIGTKVKAAFLHIFMHSKHPSTKSALAATLLRVIKSGSGRVVQRLLDSIRRREEADNSLVSSIQEDQAVPPAIDDVGGAWRVWGVLAAVVQQLLQDPSAPLVVETQDEPPISSVDDIVEHTLDAMASHNIKPVEDEPEWQGFWDFVKALQKGEAINRRRGRKPKTQRDRSPEPADVPKTPTKKSRTSATPRKSLSKVRSPTGSGSARKKRASVASPAATPSRRSGRAVPRRVYAEDSDEESQPEPDPESDEASLNSGDEGPLAGSQKPARRPRPTPARSRASAHTAEAQVSSVESPRRAQRHGQPADTDSGDEPIHIPQSPPATQSGLRLATTPGIHHSSQKRSLRGNTQAVEDSDDDDDVVASTPPLNARSRAKRIKR